MPQITFDKTEPFYIEKASFKAPLAMMHYHHGFELYYVVHGEREYFIGDCFYQVHEGDLVLIPNDLLHRTAGKGALRYLLYFSRDFLARYLTAEAMSALPLDAPAVYRVGPHIRTVLEQGLEDIYTAFEGARQQDTATEAYLASSLAHLLLLLTRTPNHYVQADFSDKRIADIVRYINEQYSTIESIDQIAERFYISKYHLCRIFNKNLGVSLISYLNTIKIRGAIELMQSTHLNITDIATRCGFNSSSYFCKVFTDEIGLSPTAYRKKLL